jgi:hypothetical protein
MTRLIILAAVSAACGIGLAYALAAFLEIAT